MDDISKDPDDIVSNILLYSIDFFIYLMYLLIYFVSSFHVVTCFIAKTCVKNYDFYKFILQFLFKYSTIDDILKYLISDGRVNNILLYTIDF